MRRLLPVLLLLIVASFATSAHAEFYLGASYLSTDAEFDTAVDNFDTDDSSYKFFGGFTMFKFFGLEASYRDLGTHMQTVGTSTVDVDLDSFDVEARGILPIGKLKLFAKVGYALIGQDGTFDDNGTLSSIDEDDWELLYGVGAEFHFGGFFGLRAEWETYDVSSADLNSFSAGAVFRF